MATTAEKPKGGLEDVVATSSRICFLDGDRGVLAYCGHDIHDLARNATFEETCYLLWHGRLPNRAELGDLQTQLAAARPLPEAILRLMKMLPPSDGMDALRTLTSALGHYDQDAHDNSLQASYRKAVRLTGQIASIVATWGRMQEGGGPIAPDPAMGHAANFLYMLFGRRPNPTEIRAMDIGADAARRSRAQRLDVRRARRGGNAHRHPLGDRRRHRHAEGTAARRRQRRSDEDADRDRAGRAARSHRRVHQGQAGAQRERFPASAIASTTPKIRARRTCARCRRSSARRRQHEVVRDERAHRSAHQGGEEALSERRLSTRRRRITRWASRSISTRRSSRSAASAAGRRTSSSICAN
jgi:hypothetical protein